MRLRLVAVALLGLGLMPDAASPDLDAIDRFVQAQLRAQHVPGLALAIVRQDRVLSVRGYGSAGNGQPVTPETQFCIASLSKSITALAVMQLAAAGKLQLDAPVQRYLPDFALADPDQAATITLRQLLNQVSGLADAGFPESMLPQPASLAERVQTLRDARPVAPPGAEFHYFNPNYAVLARVVEVASGQPFADYVQARIFAPLQMRDSFAAVTTADAVAHAPRLSQGHFVVFGNPVAAPELPGFLGGSGGVVSTANDMAQYLVAQLQGGQYDGHAVIAPDLMAAMHTPPPGSTSHYAMGWFAQPERGIATVQHNGVLSTFYSEAVLLPESGYGFVLLANANGAASAFLGFTQIKQGLIDLLSGRQPSVSQATVGRVGIALGLLTLATVGRALRSLLRFRSRRAILLDRPAWQLVPGIVWAFVPAVVFVALPALLVRLADRAFGYTILARSMPDVLIWLGLTGVLGIVNGVLRLALLLRRWPSVRRPGAS